MKKKVLYFVFIVIIIASSVVLYMDLTKTEEDVPEIYEPTPSEIEVDKTEYKEQKVEKEVIKMSPDVNLAEERRKHNNQYIVGRLEIPDLFNVLVAQSNDNDFYLSHAINKSYDIRGSEFLDYRVKPTSKQLNIYGHNTRDKNIKVAFLKLEKFLKKDFFDKNQYIIFQHDGGKNIYKIVSIKQVKQSTDAEHMKVNFTGSAFVNHVKAITTGDGLINSRIVRYDENSEIIVLQTCSHDWDNALYIIVGVKIN
jgi:sortase B